MKKKKCISLFVTTSCIVLAFIIGFTTKTFAATGEIEKIVNRIHGNEKFLPISQEHIVDKGLDDVYITEYVNTENKTIYIAYDHEMRTGGGSSFIQEYDENGKPILYKGDIKKLKDLYD